MDLGETGWCGLYRSRTFCSAMASGLADERVFRGGERDVSGEW